MVNRILYAEDDRSLRESVVSGLKLAFCDVEFVQAGNRKEALDIIGLGDLRLVVTDLQMPDKGDGEAVIRAANNKGISVIVFSGSIEDISDEVRGLCFYLVSKGAGAFNSVASKIEEFLS